MGRLEFVCPNRPPKTKTKHIKSLQQCDKFYKIWWENIDYSGICAGERGAEVDEEVTECETRHIQEWKPQAPW